MKKVILPILLSLNFVSCRNKINTLVKSDWYGVELPFNYQPEFSDASFIVYQGNEPKEMPFFRKGHRLKLNFKEGNTVELLSEIDSIIPIYSENNSDSIIAYDINSGLYVFKSGIYNYEKKDQTILITFNDTSATFNITQIHGHIMGGSGPRLTLNDSLKFRD